MARYAEGHQSVQLPVLGIDEKSRRPADGQLAPESCVVMVDVTPAAGPSPLPDMAMNSFGAIAPVRNEAALAMPAAEICGAAMGAIFATKPW